MSTKRFASLLTAAIITAASASAPLTLAQTTTGQGQALEIAPPVITLTADPGQTIKTTISLRDVSSTPLVVTNEVNDFTAAGLDGTPNLMIDEETTGPYSLKEWVSPISQILLKPGEVKQVPVTINVPKDASPGAHYGVIRFTGTPPDLEDTGVSLSASLGALVLLKVNGAVKEELSLAKFFATHNDQPGPLFEGAPIKFNTHVKNNGNMFEAPTGNITIKNMFGKTIAAVNINLEKRYVLPDSTREFSGMLDKSVIGDKMLFGRYTAQLKLTYGTDKKTLESTLSFWVVPYKLIGGGIALLIIGFFTLRLLISRYNRRIINKAQGSKSKSKK
jgi:hypothetical protein